ncbi:MAG: TolC family protein [Pseudomonas sp.]
MRSVLLALTILLSSAPLLAQTLTLQDLIDRQQVDPSLKAGHADLRALDGEAKLQEDRAGWQAFAGAGAGRYRELVTEEIRDDYYGRNFSLGVRHPLLGSLKRQLDLLQSNQYEHQRQQLRLALLTASHRLALRSAYADWWRAQQEGAVCKTLMPVAAKADQVIRLRSQKGWLRGSDAQLKLVEWKGLSTRCEALTQLESDVREDLANLTMSTLPDGALAVAEPLAVQPQPLVQWQALLNQHPRVAEKQNLRDQADRERDNPWYSAIDSDVSLAGTREYRSGSNKAGSGLVASLNFSMPFDLVGNTRARQQVAEARYEAANDRIEAEQRSLSLEFSRALRAQSAAQANLTLRRQQWQVAAKALDEQKVRGDLDAEGNPEGQLNAERTYYQSAFDLIAAWHAAWLRQADLNLFTDDSPQYASLLGDELQEWTPLSKAPASSSASVGLSGKARASANWVQATYVWDSQVLLDAKRRPAELQTLRKAGMQKIYLGLNAAQIADLDATREALSQLLRDAAQGGLQVSLLLGDPAWIEPQHRAQLPALLGKLKGLPFMSVHLDLEVEQLGWPVPDKRLQDWLDTLLAASAVSPWPVEIASHPRWFAVAQSGHPCVPCGLAAAGVHQVSLMIYTRNPKSSGEQIGQIATHWPDLQFRLAQSAERQLPANESWAGVGAEQLQRQVSAWREQLQPLGIAGIDWQAWGDFPKL